MRSRNTRLRLLATFGLTAMLMAPTSAGAAPCGNGPGGFNPWLSQFKLEASAKGISGRTISRAFDGVTYDRKVIRLDRGQRSFKQSFEQFYKRRASPWLLNKARGKLKRHAGLLSRIERRYGVPPEIVVTIWGMESTFGQLSGKMSIIRSLSTLAYDCRRSEFFTNELHAALRIIERGDMSPAQMRGGWAGEIGQTQFLASSYMRFAVDQDGNGRRDLIRSVPDVLGSTANYLKAHGWRRGGSWEAGTNNYEVLRQWNRASVYVQTISVMADKLSR